MTDPTGVTDELLSRTFVSLADTLVTGFDVVDLLDDLVRTCVELFGVAAAGLMLIDPHGDLRVMASSTEQTYLLELLQIQNDAGPCLECCRSGVALSVEDIGAAHERWPQFVDEATSQGFESVYALPMRLRDDTLGALNLFARPGHGLAAGGLRVAQALADVATIGLIQHRALQRSEELAEQLQTALNSRVVIEQAKGILAERGQVDVAQTFEQMRRYARRNHLHLEQVARSIIAGDLRSIDP